ncbi:hypothetical protein Ctob_002094, partial [Chrysochromulina tobinii]
MPLAWALRDVIGPLWCAATAYAVAEVLSRRARTLWTSDATAVAPAFKLLSELVRVNPTWAGLTAPGVAAGLSFVVRDVIETNYGGKYGRSQILKPRRAPTAIHTLGSMSSAAAAADAPEEFAALAEYAVDDFMSEAASDVEVFATTEGHGD